MYLLSERSVRAEERLASDLEILSLSALEVGAEQAEAGGGGQEAPLDSLLASAAQPAGGERSRAEQVMCR